MGSRKKGKGLGRKPAEVREPFKEAMWLFSERGSMTRHQAIIRVRHLLNRSPLNPTAHRLIGLFDLGSEELAEAGVSFEVLKAIEGPCVWSLPVS